MGLDVIHAHRRHVLGPTGRTCAGTGGFARRMGMPLDGRTQATPSWPSICAGSRSVTRLATPPATSTRNAP